MSNIAAAQQARIEKSLSSLIRREDGKVMTKAEYLKCLVQEGRTPRVGEKYKIQYNRTKFNRMSDHREQEAYSRACEEKVVEYQAVHPEGYWRPLTKTEYDYFVSLYNEAHPAPDETGEEYASDEELNYLFGFEKKCIPA